MEIKGSEKITLILSKKRGGGCYWLKQTKRSLQHDKGYNSQWRPVMNYLPQVKENKQTKNQKTRWKRRKTTENKYWGKLSTIAIGHSKLIILSSWSLNQQSEDN